MAEEVCFVGVEVDCDVGLPVGIWTRFALGDASGDKEGKDSRVLAELSLLVIADCLREPARTMPDLREAVDSWEEERCSLSVSAVLAMAGFSRGLQPYHMSL